MVPKIQTPHKVTTGIGYSILQIVGAKPAKSYETQKQISNPTVSRCGYILDPKIINYEFKRIPIPTN